MNMRLMNVVGKYMKKFVLNFSRKHPTLYGWVYLLLFMIFLTMLSFLPYVYRAIAYPLFYEKENISGIIEEVTIENESVYVKRRTTDMPTYYFKINDTYVRVTPSIAREYEEGDVYEYVQYTRGDKVIGDCREYSLLWGLLVLLMEFIIGFVAISYFCVETGENQPEKKPRELPQPMDYSQLSTKELYELCRSRDIDIMDGKRKNHKYLENCLRSADWSGRWYANWSDKQERKIRPWKICIIIIAVVAIMVVSVNYVKFIHHFIYLFM